MNLIAQAPPQDGRAVGKLIWGKIPPEARTALWRLRAVSSLLYSSGADGRKGLGEASRSFKDHRMPLSVLLTREPELAAFIPCREPWQRRGQDPLRAARPRTCGTRSGVGAGQPSGRLLSCQVLALALGSLPPSALPHQTVQSHYEMRAGRQMAVRGHLYYQHSCSECVALSLRQKP